jgi:hypothetical protein
METKKKRSRIPRQGGNSNNPLRRFKSLYPEYYGLDPDSRLVFEKTPSGYKAMVKEGSWIGMPAHLIEKNRHLFLELLKPTS